jgi:hypothetical protein
MKMKFVAILAPALALGFLAVTAEAQQHKATRLGNPATRFAKPLKKADDLRVLLRSDTMKADIEAILNEVGWKGNHEDLDRAAATAEISEIQIPTGTRLPFMSSRKNKKPHALVDVLWAGRKPIDALSFEFSSNCVRYRLVTPKACSNFWVEEIGKDTTDPKCAPPPPPPVVSVSGASETCVTQPVEYAITVKNPPADNNVKLYVNGKELVSDKLTNGAFKFTFTGAQTPGTYEVKAESGGVSSTTSVQVKPCLPTCGITASPLPAKAGKPFTVDLSGSRVAAGVRGGVKTAKVEVVDPKGVVVDSFELGTSGMSRSDVVIKKGGIHTLRAVVTDEANQVSTNVCEAQVDVKGGFPFFVGGYFGKERLTHDDFEAHDDEFASSAAFGDGFSRCAPIAGFQIGIQPKIGDNTEFEGALGIKFPFDDDDKQGNAHTALFADAAVNYLAGKGFFGGGLSWWDIGKDSGGIGLLVQGGFDLDQNGKWQLVGQARAPFSEFDNLDNNYQLWGGIRFRPNSWK